MMRWVGVVGLGVLLGVGAVVGYQLGIALSLIAATAYVLVSPRSTRLKSSGLILASGALTAAALVGRVVFLDAADPGTTMAPGTFEFFVVTISLAVVGVGVVVWASIRG